MASDMGISANRYYCFADVWMCGLFNFVGTKVNWLDA
jgi:hypothetical protein